MPTCHARRSVLEPPCNAAVVRAGAAPVLAEAVRAVAALRARARGRAPCSHGPAHPVADGVRVIAASRSTRRVAVALTKGGRDGEQQGEEQRHEVGFEFHRSGLSLS